MLIKRAAFAAVLVVALSATGTRAADANCVDATTLVCDAGFANINTGIYDDATAGDDKTKCCVAKTCSSATTVSANCPANTILDTGAPAWTTAQTECCVSNLKCTNTAFDDGGYCPYGYTAKTVTAVGDKDPATPTVALCCERDTGLRSFPVCTDTSSAGAAGLQAPTLDATSWSVQDGNGFVRSVNKYKGMCFSVLVDDSDCMSDGGVATACCSTRKPTFVQVKLPPAMITTADTKKCRLSYGTGVANINSLKRITKWSTVGLGTNSEAKFFNVPITWKKGAKTATVCLYSNYAADPACAFEKICGVDGAVPDANGNYDGGCELRIVGRKVAGSSACCAPTFSVESFDSNSENRLAAGGEAASATIELVTKN